MSELKAVPTTTVHSIRQDTPYIVITDSASPPLGSKPTPIVLWDESNPSKTTPVVLKLGALKGAVEPHATLNVKLSFSGEIGSQWNSFYVALNGLPDGILVNGGATIPLTGAAEYDVPMLIPMPAPNAPFKWTGTWAVQTTFYDNDDACDYSSSTNVPVQIYMVTEDISAIYKKLGVPREFLDLFCPPWSSYIGDRMQWVSWATQLCFASTYDTDPDCPVPMAERVHSYRYDVWTGGTLLTNQHSGFNLKMWLKDRHDEKRNYAVNCYDQAGLVSCVLNLGLPWKVPGTDKITVQRAFKGFKPRFGYINPTNLIGWPGKTNNPFFQGVTGSQVMTSSEGRSDFLAHRWVCLTWPFPKSTDPEQELALDACAGPVAKPIPMKQYLESTIDPTTSDRYKEISNTYVLTDYEVETPFTPTWYKSGGPMQSLQLVDLFKNNPPRRTNPQPINIPFSAFGNAIRNELGRSASGDETSGAPAPSRQYVVPEDTDRTSYLPNSSQVTFHLNSSDSGGKLVEYMQLCIDVAESFEMAEKIARDRLRDNDNDPIKFLVNDSGIGDVYFTCNSSGKLHILIYGNILIWARGLQAPHADLDWVCRTMAAAIEPFEDKTITVPFDVNDANVVAITKEPDTLHVDDDFTLSIAAPSDVLSVSLTSMKNNFLFDKKPLKEGNTWIFSCLAGWNEDGECTVPKDAPGLVDEFVVLLVLQDSYFPVIKRVSVSFKEKASSKK